MSCIKLTSAYSTDLDDQELITECQHFKHYVLLQDQTEQPSMTSLYHIIKSDALESTFPNIEIALRMYLTLMPTKCTGERSFSKLKIIKNQLRNCMQQSRLAALALLSNESELLD